jgi:hypothetical protein
VPRPGHLRWLLLALALGAGPGWGGGALRFLAIGDVPYRPGEDLALETLLAHELPRGTPFLVHVGDLKGGSSPCGDAALGRAVQLFRGLPVPVVYTPGDNEWTDCRRESAGGYDPQERLAVLRRLFYEDPSVLRLADLGATEPDPDFPENYWLTEERVLFATVHVVGSNNNRVAGDEAALSEHATRAEANRRHLERVARVAADSGAGALVLLFHANAGLEQPVANAAFRAFREGLYMVLARYPGPVLGIHGDTHHYRFDRPLTDPSTGEPVQRFYRLEVPGSPVVGGVWVTVDADAPEPFRVDPVYPEARDLLTGE